MNKVIAQSKLAWMVILVACLMFAGVPQVAHASKSLPSDVVVLLGFKERYGDNNRQHLGIDVYAKEGSEVKAPISGTISFAGRVPGSTGLNVTALTISTEDGQQVSINPFATTKVKRGDTVVKGQTLGTISAVGDPSSPESHFHLSLRVNGAYKDPTHLLMTYSTAVSEKGPVGGSLSTSTPPPSTVSAKPPPVASGTTANQAVAESSEAKARSGNTQGSSQASAETIRAAQKKPASSKPATASIARESAEDYSRLKQSMATKAEGLREKVSVHTQGLDSGLASKNLSSLSQAAPDEQKLASSAGGNGSAVQGSNFAQQMGQRFAAEVSSGSLSSANSHSGQGGVLHISQGGSLGLQAEFMKYLEGMSQTELSVSIIALTVLISCVGFGVIKIAQLMGVDAVVARCKGRLARFDEIVRRKGGLGDKG